MSLSVRTWARMGFIKLDDVDLRTSTAQLSSLDVALKELFQLEVNNIVAMFQTVLHSAGSWYIITLIGFHKLVTIFTTATGNSV